MPSKSNDPIFDALSEGVEAVLARTAQLQTAYPIVIIDGRSGAGKSTFSRLLLASWPAERPVHLIALDDIYPGWDGLATGVADLTRDVLTPLRAGNPGAWRSWDWQESAPAALHMVPTETGLIVEGAGALTPRSKALADVTVWVAAPDDARQRRALARDGETYIPHWDRWAKQEERHIADHDPERLADVYIAVPGD